MIKNTNVKHSLFAEETEINTCYVEICKIPRLWHSIKTKTKHYVQKLGK